MIISHSRTVSRIGMLVALSVVLTRYFGFMVNVAGIIGLRVSFGEIPIMFSGILLGPGAGALTGVLSDLVGYVLNPAGGPYYPGFTLTAAMEGVLPYAVLWSLKKAEHKTTKHQYQWGLSHIMTAVAITGVVCSTAMNTFWIHLLYGKAYMVLLPPRLLARAFLIPIHSFVIHVMLRAFAPGILEHSLRQAGNAGS